MDGLHNTLLKNASDGVCVCMHAYQGTMGVDLRYPEGVLLSLATVINQNAMSSRECWHACKYGAKYIVCVSLSACVSCKASSAESSNV